MFLYYLCRVVMSPMATCAWAVRCHCSPAVGPMAMRFAKPLGFLREGTDHIVLTHGLPQVGKANVENDCCWGTAPHFLLAHLLCCVGQRLCSSASLASRTCYNLRPHPQVSPFPHRPRPHAGCAVQVVTESEENMTPSPPRSYRRMATTEDGS
jgi:hypothetical protein